MLSLHRSIAGASALARRHPKIIGNRPTAATAAANRLASASHHQARATFQPTGRFFLPRLRPPATVEIPIGPSHYPPSPSSQTRSFNRACAPVTGAQTLIRLELLLKSKFCYLTPAEDRRLFDGAQNGILGTFSAKIRVAYAMGILIGPVYDDLLIINDIRNA